MSAFPTLPSSCLHAYIGVRHHPGLGWKYVFFFGPSRNPDDRFFFASGFLDGPISRNTAEILTLQKMLSYVPGDQNVRLYVSAFLRKTFTGSETFFNERNRGFYGGVRLTESLTLCADDLTREVFRELESHRESRVVRFTVAKSKFKGKQFVDDSLRV